MARKRKEPELDAGAAACVYTVAYRPGLNLRAGPSMDADVIRVLKYMETVKADAGTVPPEGWVAIEGGGYCMREYLK